MKTSSCWKGQADMGKIRLTVEIVSNGETIGDKENVAAALERFGKVTIVQVQEEKKDTFWDQYLKGTPYQESIKNF